jgi:phosphinothricin acetyltransferase
MSEHAGPPPGNARPARTGDLAQISAIHNDVVATSNAIFSEIPETLETRRAWFEQRTAAGMPVLVLAAGEEILGFASYGPFRSWPGYRETVELTVHVRADRRRAGVGRTLLGALVEHARQAGMHAIVAGIDGGNEPSIALHRSFGFIEVGLMPEVALKRGARLDLLLMELLLQPGAADRLPPPAAGR